MGLGSDRSKEKCYRCNVQSSYWIEVLIVVVEGAGERREVPMPNSNEKMVTEEMVWVKNQNKILEHINSAEKTWNIKIVHGKNVNNKWKDFIVIGKRPRNLYDLFLTTTNLQKDTIKGIIKIWEYSKDQRLTENPLILIYSDLGDATLIPDRSGSGIKAIRPLKGKAWYKDDYPDLPTNVAFIFPNATIKTTAHELGHIVAYLDDKDSENSTNIMCKLSKNSSIDNRTADKDQKKAFYKNKNYIRSGKIPNQGYKKYLDIPPVINNL